MTVVNNWWFEGSGYLTDAETELAAGIAEPGGGRAGEGQGQEAAGPLAGHVLRPDRQAPLGDRLDEDGRRGHDQVGQVVVRAVQGELRVVAW
ncbi:hypothetical protein [Amycolatopsis magusensis]|uniref:Uncharacterized protein n=1 Tax=Amycolatopsis magusensis TaxID=882444 RepID=A0ABS4PV95_9PSEU|nr:hypothetical protein [Amycolatopsis magusensis]MBP2182825.1 hypothetical protein [Amycolatopsis magusensis]